MFWPERDANPFFHLMESLWMLAGRNDVEFVSRYVARMRDFSDDGVTFHGAYGYRWRVHFGRDQLEVIINALRADKDDRRQVLSMWDADVDLGRKGKDLPCNLQAIFAIAVDGRLDMTVTNRSNDLIWGAYGANAVHFSYLHEYVARSVGVEQGVYRQVSNNLHAYKATLPQVEMLADRELDPLLAGVTERSCRYADGNVEPFPLVSTDRATWDADLDMFLEDPTAMGFRDPFFKRVAVPLYLAHEAFKVNKGEDRFVMAEAALELCRASDWKLAAKEWLARRYVAYRERLARAQDDGPAYD
jgi:thymidylate synthase